MLVCEKILIGQQAALTISVIDSGRCFPTSRIVIERWIARPGLDRAYTWTEGTGHLLKGLRRRISIIHTA